MKDPYKEMVSVMKKRQYGNSQGRSPHLVHLTPYDLSRKFKDQDGRCYWFGIPLDPMSIFNRFDALAISMDRLDTSEHYTYDNVVLTTRLANGGRHMVSAEKFATNVFDLKVFLAAQVAA